MRRKRSKRAAAVPSSQRRKRIVSDFFGLVTQGRQMEGLGYFSADCVQHNPYTEGGMKELFASMAAAQRGAPKYADPSFEVKSIVADGDMVAAYTVMLASKSKPQEGGLRQVHLFRFGKGDRIVEYWDITQVLQPGMPNAAGAV
jgi:predicted SnoaL-like aldol condensation-catalyzing enzyme